MEKTQIKLAEALLRRKELQNRISQYGGITKHDVFETKITRKKVSETIDDITAEVPKLRLDQVTRDLDWHQAQLRKLDALIQQANWTTALEVPAESMKDFSEIVEAEKGAA